MKRISQNQSKAVTCPLCGYMYARFSCYQTPAGNVSACKKCGLLFRHPQPDETTLANLYKNHYGTSNIETQATSMASPTPVQAQILQFLENEFGALQGKSILDYGCGVGTFGTIAQQAKMDVFGIESDDSARQYINRNGSFGVYKDLAELKQAKVISSFDFITLIEVMEHLRQPWVDLQSLVDILSEDGAIFITTPDAKGLNARLMRGRWREILKATHLYWFDYDSLKLTCNMANLLNVRRVRQRFRFPIQSAYRRVIQASLQCLNLDGGLRIIAKR